MGRFSGCRHQVAMRAGMIGLIAAGLIGFSSGCSKFGKKAENSVQPILPTDASQGEVHHWEVGTVAYSSSPALTRKGVMKTAEIPDAVALKKFYFPYYSHYRPLFRMIFLNSEKRDAHLTFHYTDADTSRVHPKVNGTHAKVTAKHQSEFFEDLGDTKGHFNIEVTSDVPVKALICEPTTFGGKALYCTASRARLPKNARTSLVSVPRMQVTRTKLLEQSKIMLRDRVIDLHPELKAKLTALEAKTGPGTIYRLRKDSEGQAK